MTDVLHMLLGAALVAIGVLASALADRIRSTWPKDTQTRPARPARAPRASVPADRSPIADEVVAALVAAGYKKSLAAQAVAACDTRDQASPESWTAAALRRCASGSVS